LRQKRLGNTAGAFSRFRGRKTLNAAEFGPDFNPQAGGLSDKLGQFMNWVRASRLSRLSPNTSPTAHFPAVMTNRRGLYQPES